MKTARLKVIEEDTNKWKNTSSVHKLKKLILLKWWSYYPKSYINSMQLQSKYQGHSSQKQKNSKMYVSQKTPNNQSNPKEEKKKSLKYQSSGFKIILQFL